MIKKMYTLIVKIYWRHWSNVNVLFEVKYFVDIIIHLKIIIIKN